MDTTTLVRQHFPNASDHDCEVALWELTAYPAMGTDQAAYDYYGKQLEELSIKAGGGLEKAYEIAWNEMIRAHEDMHQREYNEICRF